ncbi:MAG TPA: hypothetical protein VFB99_22305, partial [Vicinamibacterales bacterium]|nr:hypothetical protein [Vicinamibacterales bacterium]
TCVPRLNSMGRVDGQPTARMSCRKVMAGGNYCFRADERRAVERRSRVTTFRDGEARPIGVSHGCGITPHR